MKIKKIILKEIKKILIIIFLSFFSVNTFAENIENIFSDINPDFKYYSQMQTLYNNWIIKANNIKLFEPEKILTRDEFIWILEEVNCNKCIQPEVSEELKNKYSNSSSFFDIWTENKYFYCIADAKEKWITTGYDVWHTCNNWLWKDEEKPFCPDNNIRLEEAVAMLFRSAWIFSIWDANKVIEQINNWEITDNLALDIKPKLANGSAYSFYWDIRKALDYSIEEYNEFWDKKAFKMLRVGNDDKVNPGKNITKADFINLAYIIFKTNSCINWVATWWLDVDEDNLWLWTNIKVFEPNCDVSDISKCKLADFNWKNNKFDFYWKVAWVCNLWVKHPDWYRWEFYNETTGNLKIKLWKFINDYSFLEPWAYNISLQVYDNCGNIWKASFYFNYNWEKTPYADWIVSEKDSDFKIKMIPKPENWETPLEVKFVWVAEWKWEHTFVWEIEWQKINWKEIVYIFEKDWVYNVKLIVTDENWNKLVTNRKITVWVGESLLQKLKIEVIVAPVSWDSPLETSFEAKLKNNNNPNIKYTWYVDWEKIKGQKIKYLFTKPWKYKVVVIAEDNNGKIWQEKIIINITKWEAEKIKIKLTANPLIAKPNTNVKFSTQISWGEGKYRYIWYIDWWVLKRENPDFEYLFTKPWNYKVKLKVVDEKWNVWVEEITIKIIPKDSPIDNPISLSIETSTLSGKIPLPVSFKWIIWWGNPDDYDYSWDFWWPTRIWKTVDYSFKESWTVTVKLTVTNKHTWETTTSTVVIKVVDRDTDKDWIPDLEDKCINIPWVAENNWCPLEIKDSDKDWVPDDKDKCVLVPWAVTNNWCPVNTNWCNSDCSCDDDAYKCNIEDTNSCQQNWVCIPKNSSWEPKDTDEDWIPDSEDECIFVPWIVANNWCPTTTDGLCDENCSCETWYVCNTLNENICSTKWLCLIEDSEDDPENPDPENPEVPKKDTDEDWIPDVKDDCVFVPWDIINDWCPILAEYCDETCSCETWYKCNTQNTNICSTEWICVPENRCGSDFSCEPWYKCNIKQWAWSADMAWTCVKIDSCLDELNGWVWIFWNAMCNTCPCPITSDFSSEIRVCDIIFPSITSPDSSEIYSKWKNWFVK